MCQQQRPERSGVFAVVVAGLVVMLVSGFTGKGVNDLPDPGKLPKPKLGLAGLLEGIGNPQIPLGRGPQSRPGGKGRIGTAARVAYDVGCRGRNLETAVAIAVAESGARPTAHNPRPPDNSYGLWQVNMLGRLGPARRARFHIASNRALFDPRVNARAMYRISHGCRRWRAWTTYTSGAYRAHLGQARAAIRRVR